MTEREFEIALRASSIRSPRAIRGARLMLVHGVSSIKAAREVGLSGQHLRKTRARLMRSLAKAKGLPANWSVVTVIVPFSVGREIKSREREVHYQHGFGDRPPR